MAGCRGWRVGALAAALLAALAVPAAAGAWTTPVGIAPGYSDLGGMAMDGAGKTTITWDPAASSVDGRIRRADGSFGPSQVLGLGSAAVAVDDHGNSYLVGNGPSGLNERRVYYRRISASGSLGPAVPLSPPGADTFDPTLAADPAGNVVAAWEVRNQDPEPKYRVQIRAVSPTGGRSAIHTMPGYGALPRVAMDPAGDATVFWWKKNGFDAVQRDGGGAFDAPVHVSATGVGTHEVLMDGSGNTTFLYQPASLLNARDSDLLVRRLSSTGELGGALRVGKVGRGAAALGIDGAANVLIVWSPYTDGPHALRDRVLSPSGVLGSPQSISSGPAVGPHVAVNPAGEAVIGWAQPEGNGSQTVHVVKRSADGTLGSRQQLTGRNMYSWAPTVGIDDAGGAIAAWTEMTNPLRVRLSVDP